MNVAVWADSSQTCGQQKFSWPTLLLWLVCSEWGWKNVKRHLVDQVSPEGRMWRGGKTRQRVGGLHWPNRDQRKPQRETGAGRAALYISVFSIFCSSLSFFFMKSLPPREVKETSVLLHEVDASLRRERNLIRGENADNTPSHMRIWPTLARVAVEIRYMLQQAVFVMFSHLCHSVCDRRGVDCETSQQLTSVRKERRVPPGELGGGKYSSHRSRRRTGNLVFTH